MAIILGSGWKYFVDGIERPQVWGTFIWSLSVQDGLVSDPKTDLMTDSAHGIHRSAVLWPSRLETTRPAEMDWDRLVHSTDNNPLLRRCVSLYPIALTPDWL